MILSGRVALVTGSTSGIGLACARALASAGAAVMVNGFGEADAVAAIRAELAAAGAPATAYDGADLSLPVGASALVAACRAALGPPDILVNNAGVQHVAPVESFPPDQWDRVIAINLSAPFHAMAAVLPEMRARGWGRIVSTASAHSLVASPFKAAYVAAKHGLAGLTKTVALEAARDGVTVNCISPGYVWTPLVERQIPDTMRARGLTREEVIADVLLASQPTRAFVTPDQVAAMLLHLCRDESASITGANLVMDGGWTAQ